MDRDLALFNMVRRLLDEIEQHKLATEHDVDRYASETLFLLDLIAQQMIANELIENFDGSAGYTMDARTLGGTRLKFSFSLEASRNDTTTPHNYMRRVDDLQGMTTDEIRATLRAENLSEDLIADLLRALGKGDAASDTDEG